MALLVAIVLMNVVAWGVLALLVVPKHLRIGTEIFGLGLGVTAYTLGVRHAFDADHIAAIDNTTRKLIADGRQPVSVGFWFALGHSGIVVLLAAGVAAGAKFVAGLTHDGSPARQDLGVVSTSASGLFLYLIGILNLVALVGIARVYRGARAGRFDPRRLDEALAKRGVVTRLLLPLMRTISRPWQMLLVGLLFGIGFDTATEVTLLILAGSGASSGLPWYAVLVLPLLFAAGMSLFDTLDGAFMNVAYRWAFAHPVRKIYYNLTITGLSVAVALLIGTIELVGVLHDQLRWHDGLSTWISGLDLNNVGFLIVGVFLLVWALAVAYWKIGRVEHRWPADLATASTDGKDM
ncbi:nickel/cobalt efflux system [Planotetraspora thailandica]|uniref:Nickel/cobalt efflux system n=1 Tax=Planotetraspora thailandica TaxID=487172 RepID=A0A8J3Y0R8_9ACTN|nr:HoxN/HupN/NixA family nickel/cobalt transporter [Planotetraspora thailandica]GII58713.1 nickel/cobalt efflux system [Planotetraspora thailandica]